MDLTGDRGKSIPLNCRFELKDAEEEWTFGNTKFDYVHARAVLSCFREPPYVIRSAFEALAPGGWLEMQDMYFPMVFMSDGNDDGGGEPTDRALYRFNQLCMEGASRSGRPWTHAQHYRRYLEEAGFEEVMERRFYWPIGAWADGGYYQAVGELARDVLLSGLEGISLRALGALGWTRDEITAFLNEVRQDLKDPSLHAYLRT